MSEDKLHPTVEEFKHFMNQRPRLVLEMRKTGKPLQEYYEKWRIHGEDDLIWNADKVDKKESDNNYPELLGQLMKYMENIDVNKIQGHMKQLKKVMNTVQLMLDGFTGGKETSIAPQQQRQLFNFFRD